MVWIFLPSALPTAVLHERVARPSIRPVQAPARSSPQPYLQLVRSRSSCRTLSRLRLASAATARREPLTWSSLIVAMSGPRRCDEGRERGPAGCCTPPRPALQPATGRAGRIGGTAVLPCCCGFSFGGGGGSESAQHLAAPHPARAWVIHCAGVDRCPSEASLVWNKLTFFQKGLVLISVPLLFQLAFFGLLADMHRSNARAVRWSIHSKEVLSQAQVVLRNLLELGTGLRGFILSSDSDLGAAYHRAAQQLPLDVRELKARVSDRPDQADQVQGIADTIDEYMGWHTETVRLAGAGQRDQAIARAKSPTNARLQSAIVEAVMAFLRTEDALDRERTQALDEAQARQRRLLYFGAVTTFLITLALAFVF